MVSTLKFFVKILASPKIFLYSKLFQKGTAISLYEGPLVSSFFTYEVYLRTRALGILAYLEFSSYI